MKMLPLSARRAFRVVPPEYAQTDPALATAYLVAVPSYLLRAEFRQATAASGLRYPSDAEMDATARAAILAAKAENEGELLALLDAADAARLDPQFELPEKTRIEMRELERALRDASPAYAKLVGARAKFNTVSAYLAAKLFLRGWENVALPFARDDVSGVPDELLDRLPEGHIDAIAGAVFAAMNVSEQDAKNCVSPSRSAETPAPSTGTGLATAEAAGTSTASSTTPTPQPA